MFKILKFVTKWLITFMAWRRPSIFLSFRPSRTANIFLFNGEANRVQAYANLHVVRNQSCSFVNLPKKLFIKLHASGSSGIMSILKLGTLSGLILTLAPAENLLSTLHSSNIRRVSPASVKRMQLQAVGPFRNQFRMMLRLLGCIVSFCLDFMDD